VDALATLVMVIVFVLMIFTLFQFHLKDMISGRDQALDQLSRRVGELADQLALERRSATDLREQVNLLTGELTSSVSIRERLQSELAASEGRLANIASALTTAQDRAGELQRLLTTAERRGQELDTRLATRDAEARDLQQRLTTSDTRARDAENKVVLTEQQAANLARQLAAAEMRVTAGEAQAAALARRATAAENQVILTEQQAANLARRLAAAETRVTAGEAQAAALARRAADAENKVILTEQQAANLARQLAASETKTTAGESQAAELTRRAAAAEARARDAEGKVVLSEQQAAELTRRLAAAESRATTTEAQAAELARRAAENETRARDIEGKVTLTEQQAAELVRRLAAAETRAREADARLEDAYKSVAVDREKVEVQLRELDALRRNIETLTLLRDQLERDLSARVADGRSAEQTLAAERRLSTDAQLRVDLLTRQLSLLQQQLGRLETALDASEAKAREQSVQIVDLGRRLNMALASKVEELARYRSEFFGRLRDVLGERSDVRVVGDRFIFETEVLFESGSAALQPEGRRQIDGVATALREISERIPANVGWILQIDGHTDRRPVVRSFQSNWELSHARAMSVVRALITGGISPERLAAAGYAEFQPIDPRDDEAAFRRNRRIELKLTDR